MSEDTVIDQGDFSVPAEEHLRRLHAHCNKCKTFLRLHYHTNTGTLAIVKTAQLHKHTYTDQGSRCLPHTTTYLD